MVGGEVKRGGGREERRKGRRDLGICPSLMLSLLPMPTDFWEHLKAGHPRPCRGLGEGGGECNREREKRREEMRKRSCHPPVPNVSYSMAPPRPQVTLANSLLNFRERLQSSNDEWGADGERQKKKYKVQILYMFSCASGRLKQSFVITHTHTHVSSTVHLIQLTPVNWLAACL